MSHIDCPHCGARNLSLFSSEDPTRCRDCGRALAPESELADLRDLVTTARRRLGRFRDLEPARRGDR
jgi:hypothetical protein